MKKKQMVMSVNSILYAHNYNLFIVHLIDYVYLFNNKVVRFSSTY